MKSNKKISIIVSVYNEQEVLPYFHREMMAVAGSMENPYEIIYVNDGSVDDSSTILEQISEDHPDIKVINLSRNFGHEAAMIAGIDYSTGDYLVCIDADLEKPPSEIPKIYQKFEEGYDIITMVYSEDGKRGFGKRYTARLYYKVLNKMSKVKFVENASDFFGISRKVADILKNDYRERDRYIRGYIQSMGFQSIEMNYIPDKRYAGESKYNFKSLLRLASVAIINFSDLPLRLGFHIAVFCFLLFGISGAFLFNNYMNRTDYVEINLIITLFLFLFTVLFFMFGIIGIYLGDIQRESKKRPIYIIKNGFHL